ncbi:glycosyltransferase family 32 protein [Pseudomonas sp. SP16.1]|uniref:glycosyltransferase family 32 protein n=1 Tax=Pseudomonas sp. SP16.1 TaxID=3458854 RepID=UPI004045DA51
MPLQAQLCLASWSYRLPDYEVVRWDEQRFDPESHPFTAAAYAAGRYAFVSDYVRMHALFYEGGIYLDVDVEVLASLDECLGSDFFIGLEDHQRFATSLIGARAGHWLPRDMLAYYDSTAFEIGRLSELVNVNEVSRLLLARGFNGGGGEELLALERVYGIGAFGAARPELACAPRVYARHLFAGTWRTSRDKGWLSRGWRRLRKLPEMLSVWGRLGCYRMLMLSRAQKR